MGLPSVETVLIVAMKNRENMGNYDRPSTLNRMKFRMIDTLVRNNSRRGSVATSAHIMTWVVNSTACGWTTE